ncbi:ribokinase [Nocardia sp. ET3-3]|uniref:Ribokinase n=1 Tax=Nocardia terrae TaxID=2675851 RepID=A0A7K1V5I4_9NOCA|nr:ribokinase [Nocardia terrae]MVU81913.1 ribokinase [Nocardia terrae]
MREPEVIVVGSVNMDLSVRVRSLPAPGQTVSGGDLRRGSGGKGANQAVAARRLGARTALIGRVGADEFGAELRAALRRAGVDDSALGIGAAATGSALIVIDSTGENMITISPGANGLLDTDEVAGQAARIAAADALLLQLEVPIAACLAAARAARAAGTLVVLNAAPLPADIGPELLELISGTDILIVNEGEAAGLLAAGGDARRGFDPSTLASALRALGPREVVVTLGSRGAVFADADGDPDAFAGFAVEAVDAVGAGDAFCAALTVHRVTTRDDLRSAVRYACAAGALATTRRGAQTAAPTGAEIDDLLRTATARGSGHAC